MPANFSAMNSALREKTRRVSVRALGGVALILLVLGATLAWLATTPGTLLAQEPENLPVLAAEVSTATYNKVVIEGPAGSGGFGDVVLALANGNYLITDDSWDNGSTTNVGAVYLYDGETHAQIARLTGSTQNDVVGNGVYALSNGNYVVVSSSWQNDATDDAGAVTLCNGETGCDGVVSTANSLVGSTEADRVGQSGITELPSGNFVVRSSSWSNGAAEDAGAVTWCSGTSGCTGAVSPSNSAIGTSTDDTVGSFAITVLANGDYAIRTPNWDNVAAGKTQAGAVRRCPATGACAGNFTSSNSLVGMNDNDEVGSHGVTALEEGGYVVASMEWDGTRGAATHCSDTACIGGITVATSLIGGAAGNYVGYGGVTALVGGGYVVNSPVWDSVAPTSTEGLVSFCPSGNPCTGVASPSDGLVGASERDFVGNGGTVPLPNGGYVVVSRSWNNGTAEQAGAVTYCPSTGCENMVVGSSNSLVGDVTLDSVGQGGIHVLTSGAFLVVSPNWDRTTFTDTGAITRCAPTGCPTGNVNQGNSLVGANTQDRLTVVTTLEGGGYVVGNPAYDASATDVGAALRCGGASGCTGVFTHTDSVLGATEQDRIGAGVVALSNGHYVVTSSLWDRGAVANVGAAIWCNRDLSCSAPVSAASALVGTQTDDFIGVVTPLPNGNYLVNAAAWDDGATEDVGALIIGDGRVGSVGEISAERAVAGAVANEGYEIIHSWNDDHQYLIVGFAIENRVVIYSMQFPLSITFEGGGSAEVASSNGPLNCTATGCESSINGTTVVTLTLTPDAFSIFQAWGGECAAVAIDDPCVVTMDRAREITASLTPVTHTLTTALAGEGQGKIGAPGINCGGDCSESFAHGTVITPTADADTNSTFAGWSGACTGTGTCAILMDGDKSVTATFAIKQLEVTLPGDVEGGTINVEEVTAQGTAATVGATNVTYPYGTTLRFTAVPDSGFTFGGWTGNLAGQPISIDVLLVEPLNVGATFRPTGGNPQPTPTSTPPPTGDAQVFLPIINR